MKRPRRSTQVRRAELTDAALQIIAFKGIVALNTRSLAAHVGLSNGAIFRHFESLDAILDSVVERVESVLAATYPPPDLPPRERLERFVEARVAAVGGQMGILRLVLSDQFLLALPESSSTRLAACVDQTRQFVLACIREGQAAGQFRRDLDEGVLAVVVLGTVQTLVLTALQHSPELTHLRSPEVIQAGIAIGRLRRRTSWR